MSATTGQTITMIINLSYSIADELHLYDNVENMRPPPRVCPAGPPPAEAVYAEPIKADRKKKKHKKEKDKSKF